MAKVLPQCFGGLSFIFVKLPVLRFPCRIGQRRWVETHCAAVQFCIGLPNESLGWSTGLALGKPKQHQMVAQCPSTQCLQESCSRLSKMLKTEGFNHQPAEHTGTSTLCYRQALSAVICKPAAKRKNPRKTRCCVELTEGNVHNDSAIRDSFFLSSVSLQRKIWKFWPKKSSAINAEWRC